MVCVYCGFKTEVVNSRPQFRSNQIWRRRRCLGCQSVFTTEESVRYSGSWRVRYPDGSFKPFVRDKLLLSVHRSCLHRKNALADAQDLTDTVIVKLSGKSDQGLLDVGLIINTVLEILKRFDKAAHVHFAAHHQ